MALLPALRCSPAWEHMVENGHRRGQSFESGLNFKNKDDDLVLFNEMQNQEKDNFLLHTADDFEDSISKLRHFSDFNLGISISTGGKSRDLLNVEDDKNDYDWLLTPPETPLFSSLDDKYPQPINLAPRGRERSQPITSRSLPDKFCQTSRTSSSPSPRSSGKLVQMRRRPSSVPRSSPPPYIRSATPTRRSFTPPNKPSTPTSRSSTSTLQRACTVSSRQSSNYGGRGPSPVKASRGNSASPKLVGWQIALPGFTSEAPPNLRTSLSDRPGSHTRGSSPTSRNGRELSGKLGRKSQSPTSSRSINSSHGQERDYFSYYSKRSLLSSGDDDEESLHSISVGISRNSSARRDGDLAGNKTMSYSRKPSKYSTTISVPKRSFDSALRLMDQWKTPQNMFRPLLSSVPASTFRPIFSRNSSLTTSSNTSSEQGVFSVSLDVEGSELEPTALSVGWERAEDSENHEEVFLFDKVDQIIEDASHEILSKKPQRRDENFGDSEDIHNPTIHIGVETSNTTLDSTYFTDNHCVMDGYLVEAVCSLCNKEFKVLNINENIKLCQECVEEHRLFTTGRTLTCVPSTKNAAFLMDVGVGTAGKELLNEVPHVGNIMGADDLPNICSIQLLDRRESELFDQHLEKKCDINISRDCGLSAPQLTNRAVNCSLKVDIPEGTGISVLLLDRSSSSKLPVLQGKTVSTTNILCSEPSYSRDNLDSLRRSTGRDRASASSLVDLGSSRQIEASLQHQLCRESEGDNMRNDINSNVISTRVFGDFPMNFYESGHLKSECVKTVNIFKEVLGYDSLRETIFVTEEHVDSLDQSNFNARSSSFSRPVVSENYISEHTDSCITISSSDSRLLEDLGNNVLPYYSEAEILCNEDCTSSTDADEHPQNHVRDVRNIGETDICGCSEMDEDYTVLNCTSQNDNLDAATKCSSIVTTDLTRGCSELADCHPECNLSHNPGYPEQSNGHSISQTSENGVSFSSSEPSTAVYEHGNHGVIIEGPRGHMSRSLTLEEATDTILFCSSIIHDLAYRAATIGMEKELNSPPQAQGSDSTMTNLEKPFPRLRESWKISYKNTPRSPKFKRKRMESQNKSPREEVENDVNIHEFTSSIETPRKVETARPPKLETKCNCTVM